MMIRETEGLVFILFVVLGFGVCSSSFSRKFVTRQHNDYQHPPEILSAN